MTRYAGKERRASFRKLLHFGTDIVRVNDTPFKRKWDDEFGVNLGADGFCCCSSRKLPEPATVNCQMLFMPPHDRKLIEAQAKLVWQRQRGGRDRAWYHGFQFTEMQDGAREHIDQVLKDPP